MLELRLTEVDGGALRGYWALVSDVAAFRRPEWLAGEGERTTFQRELIVDRPAPSCRWATIGEAVVTVNDTTLATHGSYEPYGRRQRVQPYDIGSVLCQGENTIQVHFPTGTAALLVDGGIVSADGSRQVICTDGLWLCDDDTGTAPARPTR